MSDDQDTNHRIGEIPENEKAQTLDSPDNQGDMHNDPEASPVSRGGLEAGVKSWRVAHSLDTLLKQINQWAPGRSKVSDGSIGDAAHASRSSDHNPWIVDGGVGVVTARDFTHDPAHGCDCNKLSDLLRASSDPRIKYMIWNRRICSSEAKGGQPPWAWRPYTGANPHNHHMHVSVMSTKILYDSTNSWSLSSEVPAAPARAVSQSAPGTSDHDAAMADLHAATQALLSLTPLLHRLTALQDSGDPDVTARAAELLGRYDELSRADFASQRRPAASVPKPAAVKPSPPNPLPPFKSTSFAHLKDRYEALYAGMFIRPEWASQVEWHRKKLLQYKPRYDPVAYSTGVPWWFIGIVHALEGSFNFATHLHNGDPLSERTVRHPANRPEVWNPPNDWESSATDALILDNVAHQVDWSLARTLHRLEGYNGFSYYHHFINSPYLWSFSNQYVRGKFVADHVYDENAISKQCGAAVMLRALTAAGDIAI
jgi:lysozyme family protein